MPRFTLPQLRLGCTSFVLPAGYVEGFRHGAACCSDVTLLLVDIGSRGEQLITEAEVREIRSIAAGEGTTVSVHLPATISLDTLAGARELVRQAGMACERVAALPVHTFVLHVHFRGLDTRRGGVAGRPTPEQDAWTRQALADIATLLPAPHCLAVENLEGFAPDFWDGWLAETPYTRCVDVGHLWKDGIPPGSVLPQWLARTRMVHLHGLRPVLPPLSPVPAPAPVTAHSLAGEVTARFGACPRDHTTLAHMPPAWVDAAVHPLWASGFAGVVTLEVFSPEALAQSHAVLCQSRERFTARR